MRNRAFMRLGSIIGLTSLGLAALGVACDSGRPDEPVPRARISQHQEQTYSIELRVPATVVPFAPVLVASERMKIGADAVIDPADGDGAPVVALGNDLFRVEPGAALNDVWSRGPLDLRDGTHVGGTIHAAELSTGHDVTLDGQYDFDPVFEPEVKLGWQVTYPEVSGAAVHLEPGQTSVLPPGRYASARTARDATLKLTSGSYYFDQGLELDSQGVLELDQSGGAVAVYANRVHFRGSVHTTTADRPNLLIAALGNEPVFVESSYDGALLAPRGSIVLRHVEGGHSGYFAAKEIEVDARAQVHYRLPRAVLEVAGIDPDECLSVGALPAPDEVPVGEVVQIESTSCQAACNPKALCSGHGTCVAGGTEGGITCDCEAGWTGAECEVPELVVPTSTGPAPPLTGSGPAEERVDAFMDWILRARVAEIPKALERTFAVHGDETLGAALVTRFNAVRDSDAMEALMVLSVLGEIRTDAGYDLFVSVLAEPLPPPSEGHGENPERGRLLGYQIKAVHGIGYLFTPAADAKLLELADQHEAQVVRAQAIRTYTFRQGNGARDIARAAARPEEQWFVDRFENRDLDSGKTFDERLEEFTTKHPDLVQPAQP